ncbi:MAG: TetR family transcriptional regulator [Gordonia sp. (in: high G+C Gram-positive bacteria)]
MTATRTGRRAGDSTAPDDILAAARELFAQHGFDKTTLRAVATRAGVDVALIPYYFTNKRGLYVAAMELPINPADLVREASIGPREELGRRLATAYLTVWDDPQTGPTMQAYLRSAVTDPGQAQTLGEFASQSMLPLAVEQLGISRDTVRAIVAMMFGVATMRYLVAAPAFTDESTEELIDLYAPRIQAIIDVD